MKNTTLTEIEKNHLEVSLFYDQVAEKRNFWFKKNKYFHDSIIDYYNYFTHPDDSILEIGCSTGNLIGNLKTKNATGIDISKKSIEIAKSNFPKVNFLHTSIENFKINRKFDIIILSGTLNSVYDINKVLQKIKKISHSHTRCFIEFYNPLYRFFIILGSRLNFKMNERIYNWFNWQDLKNFSEKNDCEIVNTESIIYIPKKIFILSNFFNKFLSFISIFNFLSFYRVICLKPIKNELTQKKDLKCSIVLTCRDEEGNIEEILRRIPKLGKHTEIIFVEGHSKDNTYAEIERMIGIHKDRDIKLFKQPGYGQKDALHYGFKKAKGDFIMLMESDLTTPPEDSELIWNAFISDKGDFINGSRLIYNMESKAMPFLNYIGNRSFGLAFSFISKKRLTDALCGFKGISKLYYKKLEDDFNFFGKYDPFSAFELIFASLKNKLRVIEVPVHYSKRTYGSPNAYGKGFFSFLKYGFKLIFSLILSYYFYSNRKK